MRNETPDGGDRVPALSRLPGPVEGANDEPPWVPFLDGERRPSTTVSAEAISRKAFLLRAT